MNGSIASKNWMIVLKTCLMQSFHTELVPVGDPHATVVCRNANDLFRVVPPARPVVVNRRVRHRPPGALREIENGEDVLPIVKEFAKSLDKTAQLPSLGIREPDRLLVKLDVTDVIRGESEKRWLSSSATRARSASGKLGER